MWWVELLNSFVSVLDSGGAGGGAGSYESIATATGNGSSNTITFSSIPSTYKHLQIRAIVKDTITAVSIHSDLSMTINGASSGYAFHHLYGNGSTVTADGSASQSSITIAKEFLPTSAAAQTNTMGVLVLDINDYASTTANKTLRCFYGGDNNNSPTGWAVGLSSALYSSTTAISSLTFTSPATAWTSTTQFALYGIKGA